MAQKRKFVSDYVSGHDAAEYSELLRVLRRELRAHYELPEDLPPPNPYAPDGVERSGRERFAARSGSSIKTQKRRAK
jgi:hypothetical protein